MDDRDAGAGRPERAPDDFKVIDFGRILRVMGIALAIMVGLLLVLVAVGRATGRL